MTPKPKKVQQFVLRLLAILLHALLNFIAVSSLVDFDLTGSWLVFIGFILVVILLTYLFVKHLVSFIYFIKNK